MDEKSGKPKRIGNHYIPPPARRQGNEMNETTRHKERPVKSSGNIGVKLCNDSSLLFKESNDNIKEKPRRSRRSKRTTKKADAENASVCYANEVAEPLSSPTASEWIDRIIKCQPDTGSDPAVLVERPVITSHPLIGLENTSLCHSVHYDAMDCCSSLHDDLCKLNISVEKTDQEIQNVYEEVENQLQSMIIVSPEVHRAIDEPAREGYEDDEHEHTTHSTQHKVVDKTAEVEQHLTSSSYVCSSDVRKSYRPSEESTSTTENSLCDPQFSIVDDESFNICSRTSPDIQTFCEESIDKCAVVNSDSENNKSRALRKAECSNTCDLNVGIESTQWSKTDINAPVFSIEDGDWLSIYDDRGDCLIPSVDLSSSLVSKNSSKVKPDTKKVDDEAQPHETSSIIEIYGFSEVLKTNDIMTAFGSWIQRGFNLKWIDNTHALGIFPTPALAEEALGSNIPLVKVRPISQGIPLSQERARTLVLPSSLRPKTCTALARRLVSGALGLRVNVTPEERAAERKLLREAREKKKMVLKQRDAAWEGNFSPLNRSEDKASSCDPVVH